MTEHSSSMQGACHCGAVTFAVRGPITRATRCTCSLCSRVGALWYGTDEAGLTILTGESELGLYQFGTRTAKHYYCRHCGVHPFSRPRLNPQMWVANVRCIQDVDVDALQVSMFDGAHWEEAARALFARSKAGAPR